MDYVKLNVLKEDRHCLKALAAILDISLNEAFGLAVDRLKVSYTRLANKPDADVVKVLQALIDNEV